MTEKKAQIELRIELELPEYEIWPDGDAPDGWTASHVMAEIAKSGSLGTFLSDWNADVFGADVDVWVGHDSAKGHLQ